MKLYQDQFAHIHLPDKQFQPDYIYNNPNFELESSLNCVERLLDNHIKEGHGNSVAIRTFNETWTYQDLYEKSNQIAHVLVDDLGLVSGNRVLIRSANNPMFVACWFAILNNLALLPLNPLANDNILLRRFLATLPLLTLIIIFSYKYLSLKLLLQNTSRIIVKFLGLNID